MSVSPAGAIRTPLTQAQLWALPSTRPASGIGAAAPAFSALDLEQSSFVKFSVNFQAPKTGDLI